MDSLGRMIVFRLIRAAVTIWLVVTAVFVILRLSGDPVRLLLPRTATTEAIEDLRRELGLDRSIPVQYLKFCQQIARGDFGESNNYHRPALNIVLERFPATIELALVAFVLAALFGLAIGSTTAATRGSTWDEVGMTAMGLLQAAPSFFLGIMLILVFSVHLGWFPASGRGSLDQIVLPAVTLGALTTASLARMTRSSILEVSKADYVRTARAKGLTEGIVWRYHILRNASLPIVTVFGLELADLLTGAVIVETVFAWPGLGRLAVDSIASRDYPVVQAAVLLFSAVYIGINLILDLLYQVLDPRTRNA